MPYPIRLSMTFLVALPQLGWADVSALDCEPPVSPEEVTDARVMAEYRDEISAEYMSYFDDAQRYLLCLDAARNAVDAELRTVLAAYQRFDASSRR